MTSPFSRIGLLVVFTLLTLGSAHAESYRIYRLQTEKGSIDSLNKVFTDGALDFAKLSAATNEEHVTIE